jgi:NADH-dependent peroxiredoxin subunit C
MITVESKVPDMEVQAYHGGKITKIKLSDYAGKWLVLLFYPADFTFVCPTELGEAADNYEKFRNVGAEVASVSVDSVFVHKAWHDQSPEISKIKYPMIADPTGAICKAFGTYIEAEGVSFRATFIIDPDGVVKAIDMHDNSIGRSTAEILRKLEASVYVRGHKGEACPASWQPGGKTLKPGLNLVGKI